MVQELIRIGQEVGFEKFVMRAMHDEDEAMKIRKTGCRPPRQG